MHKIDQSVCVKCGACAGTCPVEAIIEKDGGYEVTDACVDCGATVGFLTRYDGVLREPLVWY